MKKRDIKAVIKELGYELLDNIDYDSFKCKDIVPFKDKEGYKYTLIRDCIRIKNGKFSPNKVDSSNLYSIENIKLYIKINNLPIVLLSTEYKGVFDFLDFIGECGHLMRTSWHTLKIRNQYCCPECMNINNGLKKRINKEDIKNLFENNGLIILENMEELENKNNILILCKDKDGYKGKINYSNLKMGKSFKKFSKHNIYTSYNINNYLQLNNMNLKLLTEKEVIDCEKEELCWLCNCGNIFYRKWGLVYNRGNIKCKDCTSKSQYETEVSNFLKENKINYIREKTFDDFVNKETNHHLYFDFYLPEYNLCIEVDGIGHRQAINWNGAFTNSNFYLESSFKNILKRDNMKNEYCKIKNIELVRITDLEIKNKIYKTKLTNYLK